MKGPKRRTSVDPPLPPASTADEDGCAIVGVKCAEAGKDLHPVLESPVEEKDKLLKTPVKKSAANGDDAGAGDGDDKGEEEVDDEEEQDEGEKRGNDDKDMEIEDAGADAGKEDGPVEPLKLAEGFYEIEAVRKKRTRKGKPEYLIKWRGWPETANTWEPMDNLVCVPDVIAAFEERSRKHSSRKNKRKNGNSLSQSKKKQFKSSPLASTCNIPDVKVMILDETSPAAAAQTETGALNHGGCNDTGIIDLEAAKQSDESGVKLPASGTEGTEIGNGVTATPDKENIVDKCQDKSQLARISGQAAVANGSEVTESAEAIQNGHSTGAKRRKSGPVRRFKQDSNTCSVQELENAASNFQSGSGGNQFPQNSGVSSTEDGGCNTKTETYKAICDVIEIIKPMNYTTSVSGNNQDVCVTFAAKRADGKEVTVDNKFLKSHNPVLLLNYYEQHLRYSTVG